MTTTAALQASTVTAGRVSLKKITTAGPRDDLPVRLVLAASGRTVSIVPVSRHRRSRGARLQRG